MGSLFLLAPSSRRRYLFFSPSAIAAPPLHWLAVLSLADCPLFINAIKETECRASTAGFLPVPMPRPGCTRSTVQGNSRDSISTRICHSAEAPERVVHEFRIFREWLVLILGRLNQFVKRKVVQWWIRVRFNPMHSFVERDSTLVFITGALVSSHTHFWNRVFMSFERKIIER